MFSSNLPCQGLARTDDTGKALKPNLCNVSDHNNDGKVDRKLCVDTHHDLCCPMHCVQERCATRFELDQDRWGAQCLCPSALERIWKGKYFDVCSRDRHQWRWHCHRWLWDNAKWELAHKMHKLHLSSALVVVLPSRNRSQCASLPCDNLCGHRKIRLRQFAVSETVTSNLLNFKHLQNLQLAGAVSDLQHLAPPQSHLVSIIAFHSSHLVSNCN